MANKMNKRITDLTEQEVREFFKDFADELIECSFDKKTNEIKCKMGFKYMVSLEDKTMREGYLSLILSDPYYLDDGEESLYTQYGEDALEDWKQFCFAKGIYPDWMLNNPYTETHVLQLTDEQLELIQAALDFMQTKLIERDGESESDQEVYDLLNYLSQFRSKDL